MIWFISIIEDDSMSILNIENSLFPIKTGIELWSSFECFKVKFHCFTDGIMEMTLSGVDFLAFFCEIS